MIVDLFAGAGGASLGFLRALGRAPDVAVNHWRTAISVHARNHPQTRHFVEDVFDVNPRRVCGDELVEALWMSPDCTDFSKAKNSKPRSKKTRGLAWVALRWCAEVRPRVLFLENVEEFQGWGPLDENDRRIPEREGETFREWLAALRALGYVVEWRCLVAADYGAPTTRKRLFLIARCDGLPICWPEPTHGKGRTPWRTAAEIIDWSIPVPSIFERVRPLADPTLQRIAVGTYRYAIEAAEPFVVQYYGTGTAHPIGRPLSTVMAGAAHHALVVPTLIQTGYGEREGQAPRVLDLHKPLGTVVAGGSKHGLAVAFLAKHYGGVVGHDLHRPIGTVTTQDHHALTTATLMPCADHRAEVRALLDRFAPAGDRLVRVHGETYEIGDLGMRMLVPRELARAQDFPDSYVFETDDRGEPITKTNQQALIGNSVSPAQAAAIVRANVVLEQRAAA